MWWLDFLKQRLRLAGFGRLQQAMNAGPTPTGQRLDLLTRARPLAEFYMEVKL